MEKLFRCFSQITSFDMPKHEGTGLGLYISKKLMNLLGGDIRAESEFGMGSVFTVTLPLLGKEAP
jgi:signal transduction histidine kinase